MNLSTWLMGLSLGLGVALVVSWLFARRPTLERRIAPFVRTAPDMRREGETLGGTPFPTVERLLAPVLRDGVRTVERWGASAQELRTRLRRAGSDLTVEQFRAQQVMWGIASLVLGVSLSILLALTRGSSPVALLALTVAFGAVGVIARDYEIGRAHV